MDAEPELSADRFRLGCDAVLENETDDQHWTPDPIQLDEELAAVGGTADFSANTSPPSPTTSENRRCCLSNKRISDDLTTSHLGATACSPSSAQTDSLGSIDDSLPGGPGSRTGGTQSQEVLLNSPDGTADSSTNHSPPSPTTSKNRRCSVSNERPSRDLTFNNLTPDPPSPTRSTSRRPAPWTWAAISALLAGLLLFKSFLPGLTPESSLPTGARPASAQPASELVNIPIEQIRVGLRVPGLNPELDAGERGDPDPDPATWRQLDLRAPKTDGTWADVVLLRPLSWLQEQQAEVGGQVHISVPECGIDGNATVRHIDPCPPIPPGPGRVVTGTFRHASAHVLDLHVDGIDEPIGTTANHPFWSEDRQQFLRADQLRPGERLRTLQGTARLIDAVPRSGTEPVYNLEVQTEHVYHITTAGVLVHNGTSGDCSGDATPDDGVVYLRYDHTTKRSYVGQAKSMARYKARQKEHRKKNKDADYEFFELGRAKPGKNLDRLEESWIRAGGGPTNKSHPDGGLENLRHQMSASRYRDAGGNIDL